MPGWVKTANGTVDDLNLNLCTLRTIGIEMAGAENARFADVFWPMLTAGAEAQQKYGTNFAIAGKDGVHPGWAGQTVMAYAFLKALGLNGDIGTFTVDLKRNSLKVSKGHEVISSRDGEFQIRSSKYPFCPCLESGQATAGYPVCGQEDLSSDGTLRSALALVPFNKDLNQLMLIVKNAKAPSYSVVWGNQTNKFAGTDLSRGINLAAEFPFNPFAAAFAKVDAAVATKQAYETKEIKQLFRSAEAKTDMDGVAGRAEQERTPLAAAIAEAFVPVVHTIRIQAR